MDNNYLSNFLLSLYAFMIYLSTLVQTHFMGIMTGIVVILTALNQFRRYRNSLLEKEKIELEIENLKKIRQN